LTFESEVDFRGRNANKAEIALSRVVPLFNAIGHG